MHQFFSSFTPHALKSKTAKAVFWQFPCMLVACSLILTSCQYNENDNQALALKTDNSPVVNILTHDQAIRALTADYEMDVTSESMTIQSGQNQVSLHFEGSSSEAKLKDGEGEARYSEIYPGTDLRLYSKGDGNAGYDFELAPGADPAKICLKPDGANQAFLNTKGELVLPLSDGEIRHSAPQSYQMIEGSRVEVASRFVLNDGCVGFELGDYDPAYGVTIDPKVFKAMAVQPNFDIPVSLFESHNGNLRVADGGVSLYPSTTSGSFDVTIDACAAGTPTVVAAYLTWYTRVRVTGADASSPAVVPNFDHIADVRVNSAGAFTSVTASDDIAGTDTDGDDVFLANLASSIPANTDRIWWRAYRVIDLVQNAPGLVGSFIAGTNTIDVSGLDLPTTPAGLGSNNNYGVALTVVYECSDFSNVDVHFNAGLDFVYCNNNNTSNPTFDDSYVGSYSNVLCQSIPASTAARNVNIEGIIGGQQNTAAPFRGNVLRAWSGTGTVPTTVASAPTNQAPVGAYDFDGNPTLVSNLGTEWDEINGVLNVPIGDTYVCVQMESVDGLNFATDPGERCISGDMLSPVFVVPAAVAAPPVVSCNCTDYIYVNDISATLGGEVHKFGVNAGTGALNEVLNGGNPWYPGAGASEMPSPHGLGVDRNGFLFRNWWRADI